MSHLLVESAIYQEAEIVKREPTKAIFRMTMQTVDEINSNNRIYPKSVLNNAMKEWEDRIPTRSFFGELDHPTPTGDQTFNDIRQTTVLLKEVSHIVKAYDFVGNRLIGELETTNTPNGRILYGLIQDKAGIGLSMRGLAELERLRDHSVVKHPLLIISFDSVSRPSHRAATIDFSECRFESSVLVETPDLICCGGKCFLPEYFDKLIETKVIEFTKRWV